VRILPGLALGLWTWWRRLVRGGRHGLTLPAARRRVRPSHHWARNGPVKIAYELRGRDGPAVVLVHGVAMGRWGWAPVAERLARDFRVVTIDNRGVGDSDAPVPPYSAAEMAADVLAVLDAEGIDRCHLVGASLGGMVAQQLALRHPDRVRSLVLGATHAGGVQLHWPDADVLEFLSKRLRMRPEEGAWSSVAFNYGERCRREHPERIAEDIAQRLAHPFPEQAYRAQLWAGALHDTSSRLHRIAAPTLVVHGSEDRMIPVQNGRMLADRIPNAQLIEVEDSGHLYPTEAPQVDEAIAEFMDRHS
jgi:3-oxoadipate enol-lactonase